MPEPSLPARRHSLTCRQQYVGSNYRTLVAQFAYNGAGVSTSKTVRGDTTQYVLDLAATLPLVISDTEAVYLRGLGSEGELRVRRAREEAPQMKSLPRIFRIPREAMDTVWL